MTARHVDELTESENSKSKEIPTGEMDGQLVDNDDDWATSMMLHVDAQENFMPNFNLFRSNNTLLKSLIGKPIRKVNKNSLRLTYVPEDDETLPMECVGECECCKKCPLCKYFLENSEQASNRRKIYRDETTQTTYAYNWKKTIKTERKIRKKKIPFNSHAFGKGDNRNRGIKSRRESSSCSTTLRCVDKPNPCKKVARPLVELYPEYIKYMIRRQWTEMNDNFKQSFRNLSPNVIPILSHQEVKKCRKRIGYHFSAEQLENMFNVSLKQAKWAKVKTEDKIAVKPNLRSGDHAKEKIISKSCNGCDRLPAQKIQSHSIPAKNVASPSSHCDSQRNRKYAVKMTKATVLRAQAIKDKHPWLRV